MPTNLDVTRVNLTDLAPENLVIVYRNAEDYQKNDPELYGVIELRSEGNPDVWNVKYRDTPRGPLLDGIINLDGIADVLFVSGSPSLVGKKNK